MVHQRHANHEAVAKVHTRHGSKVVHKFTRHPHGLGVVAADSVDEAVFLREQTGRHAREEGKYGKGHPVAECYGAPYDGEGSMIRGGVVVPCDETISIDPSVTNSPRTRAKRGHKLGGGGTYNTLPGM